MELWLDATEKLRKTKATKGLEFPAASEAEFQSGRNPKVKSVDM